MPARTTLLLRAATAFLLVLTSVTCATGQTKPATAPPASQSFTLTDTGDLAAVGVHAAPVEYQGRKAVRLVSDAEDSAGYATVKSTSFRDGSIDVDVAVVPRDKPGGASPGFIGVVFRLGQDPSLGCDAAEVEELPALLKVGMISSGLHQPSIVDAAWPWGRHFGRLNPGAPVPNPPLLPPPSVRYE